jgi:hypothetical protein
VPVWDRGFAGQPWLDAAFSPGARFVLRGPKRYGWQLTRGLRSGEHRWLWHARRRGYRKTGVLAGPVYDSNQHPNLWVVLARPGKGPEPC